MQGRALVAGLLVGGLLGLSCGPAKVIGPTALVLEVYFSEPRGTRAFLISGTAVVNDAEVNVFPTTQRPEELTAGAFPVPQTVRVLLNDSRAGAPVQLTVLGLNSAGEPVEAATQAVTPVAQAETLVTVTLKPFTDSVDPDAGSPRDAGFAFDGGARDAGLVCRCAAGCCDATGLCAQPLTVRLGSNQTLPITLSGPSGGFCTTACQLGKASVFDGQCKCGSGAECGPGLRCSGVGAQAKCVCDRSSGCATCCSSTADVCEPRRQNVCGTAGNACSRCDGPANVCGVTSRCTQNMCPAVPVAGQCCSGAGPQPSAWPTCTGLSGDCVACDVLRSNTCRPVSLTGASNPCSCGNAGPCSPETLCILLSSGPACVKP
jgi:hypothetical protein